MLNVFLVINEVRFKFSDKAQGITIAPLFYRKSKNTRVALLRKRILWLSSQKVQMRNSLCNLIYQSNLCLKTTHWKRTIRSLFTGSFKQKMNNWEIKSVNAIDREWLNKGGLYHRFDRNCFSKSSMTN